VTEKLNNHQVIPSFEIIKEGIYPSIEGPASWAVRLWCSVPICWPAASAMNSFIPCESATLSLNLVFSHIFLRIHYTSLRSATICFIAQGYRLKNNELRMRVRLLTVTYGRRCSEGWRSRHRFRSEVKRLADRSPPSIPKYLFCASILRSLA
jgi:hypothetical protein